jgi:mRNA degradation ribonuclease J1/J2
MVKMEFLGVGSGFSTTLGNNNCSLYKNDITDGHYLIDCGESTRLALVDRKAHEKILGVFITHIHGDHVYGLEMLGFYYHFALKKKLSLILPSESIKKGLWDVLSPSMKDIQNDEGEPITAEMEDYFDVQIQTTIKIFDDVELKFIEADHVVNKECYGLEISTYENNYLYTSDQRSPRKELQEDFSKYKYIWHDCQLYDAGKGGVHAFIDDLKEASSVGQSLFLMHYNRNPTKQDEVNAFSWCGGFVKRGQVFEII